MVHVAYLMLLFPLAGFLLLLALGRRIGDPVAGWIGIAMICGGVVLLARRRGDSSIDLLLARP